MEKFLNALVGELSLFKKLSVIFVACVDSLTWWEIHESQFPNLTPLLNKSWEFQDSDILILNVCSLSVLC
jgi:hypothetical protein